MENMIKYVLKNGYRYYSEIRKVNNLKEMINAFSDEEMAIIIELFIEHGISLTNYSNPYSIPADPAIKVNKILQLANEAIEERLREEECRQKTFEQIKEVLNNEGR